VGESMEKRIIREFLRPDNEEEKSEYIRDLSNAILEYAKTGNPGDLLNNFQQYTSEIRREFTKARDENEQLLESLKEEIHKQLNSNKFDEEALNQIQKKLNDNMKKIMYLSHLNMLVDLYINELELREEQNIYIKATEEFPKLLKITAEISKMRWMNGSIVKESFELSDKECNLITGKYQGYFNIRTVPDDTMGRFSLSPNGKKYLKYMIDTKYSFTQSQVEGLVVKNCEAIINSIPVSIVNTIPQRIRFTGMTPVIERNLQFAYDQVIFDVTRSVDTIYSTFGALGKERYNGDREKYRFPIYTIKGNC